MRRTAPQSLAILAALAAILVLAVRAHAADTSFPDDWFFSGAGRPAQLRELEGKPAPDLSTQQWIGDKVALADVRGKVVVLDFWATWCGPCMAAIPHNVELVDKYKDKGLVFIGVHDSKSGWDKAAGVVRDRKINYPVALDDAAGASTKAYNLQFWPTYVVIDHTGTIRGAGLLPDKVEGAVERLLKEAADAGVAAAPAASAPIRADWYYSADARPKPLVEREGKPIGPLVPALDAKDRWIGAPQPPSTWTNRVVVLHFFSTRNAVSMRSLKELDALVRDLMPQGVTFVGVCDAYVDAEALAVALKGDAIVMPVVRDLETPGEAHVRNGAFAKSLGVAFAPTTIVVDRAGRLRVAGARVDRMRDIANTLLAERLPAGTPAPPAPRQPAATTIPPSATGSP